MRGKRFEVNLPALVAIRMKAGLSQRKLAKAVGVHPSYIGQVEAEFSPLSDKVLFDIAKELGVPVDAIARVVVEETA